MRHRLPLLIALVAIGLSAACGDAQSGAPLPRPSGDPSSPGDAAYVPHTPLVALDGRTTDLPSEMRGRATVVSLWATWCDACSREIPALERLHSLTASRPDALVVGIAVGEPREAVAAFIRDRGVRIPQLVDERFHLVDALGERRVPSTLVVDHAGRVVFREGALDAAGLSAFRSALGAIE